MQVCAGLTTFTDGEASTSSSSQGRLCCLWMNSLESNTTCQQLVSVLRTVVLSIILIWHSLNCFAVTCCVSIQSLHMYLADRHGPTIYNLFNEAVFLPFHYTNSDIQDYTPCMSSILSRPRQPWLTPKHSCTGCSRMSRQGMQ